MGLSGHLFFRLIFSLQIRLSPQIPLLQTTGHLQASCKMIRDPNWGLGGPKCVKTIRKHHKYPPKVSPNTFGNFFFGSFFTPNRPKTAKSPTLPLQTTRPLLASRRVIKDANWGLEGPKCVNTIQKLHKYAPKVSPNTFGNLFLGSFFTPNRPKTAKSPSPPLAGY